MYTSIPSGNLICIYVDIYIYIYKYTLKKICKYICMYIYVYIFIFQLIHATQCSLNRTVVKSKSGKQTPNRRPKRSACQVHLPPSSQLARKFGNVWWKTNSKQHVETVQTSIWNKMQGQTGCSLFFCSTLFGWKFECSNGVTAECRHHPTYISLTHIFRTSLDTRVSLAPIFKQSS